MATEDELGNKVGIEHIGEIDTLLNRVKVKTRNEKSYGVAIPTEIDSIIKGIILSKKMTVNQENFTAVLLATAHLCQIGATSPKFAASEMIFEYGVEVKAGELREACKKNGTTVRKFARGIKDIIIKVALALNLQGNLAKTYRLENPACDAQDLVWASDFQTFSENKAMPEGVKQWLLENYRRRFKPSN